MVTCFFTNWVDLEDKITWEVEVLQSGEFEVELYYTCAEEDKGAKLELVKFLLVIDCYLLRNLYFKLFHFI